MTKIEEEIKLPYLDYVMYNQEQSERFWLNHTQSIIMNYFAYVLPTFWVQKIINGKCYYWLNYKKLFNDLPTLSVKNETLRKNINKFIKEWILFREIKKEEWKLPRAFYRVSKNFLIRNKETPVNFSMVYNNIESLLKEGRINSNEKNKINKLLSSYKGKTKINKTTYNLEGIGWTDIMDFLKKELSLSSEGKWVKIDVWTEINEKYVIENIFNKIRENGKNYWWIKPWFNWDYPLTDEIKGKILGNLMKMFQWLKDNNKTIKSFKWQINTWFWKTYI